ncbi:MULTISPECIES: hypothetical protein [unclassified Crossiella]|uniref:hypothetical protein n=1 Tax=unclassified Crossiella TaxID=2620835 RepID=UPI001FFF8A07|nr:MULTISPECIES: hypothetical protein [unclassified Crossiella]MCK2242288.1 hypothetical protein [Crossiella sp. S99.2]MCK2254681.1 hypothetical protein [Crossiella sp. S99.1]
METVWSSGRPILDVHEPPDRCTTRGRECYRAVATRLAELAELAATQPDPAARNALLRTVHGWQFLLAQHRAVGRKKRRRCRLCRPSWGLGGEWPCPTWRIAYVQLCLVEDSPSPELSSWPSSPPPGQDDIPVQRARHRLRVAPGVVA